MTHPNPFFPRHAFAFKGGGGAPAGPIPAPPAPPASGSDLAVTEAKLDAKKAAKQKEGITSTILGSGGLAGAPAGGAAAPGAKNTTLGSG